MPHTRSKRAKAAAQAAASAKPVHTKRIQVLDEEGWTHVIDTARKTKAIAPVKDTLQVGDFEQNGIHYVNKTQEEYSKDLSTHTKAWKGAQGAQLREKIVEIKDGLRGREVRNVVCLGLGSLQSARREGRRASWTQLVALRGVVEVLVGGGEEIQCVFQDPQFSAADTVFLSSLGYEVVDDPEAFTKITEDSLVYAIHCYADVYKSVSEGPRPLVLVGSDVENFRKFNTSEKESLVARSLRDMVEDCEEVEFTQVRHDFSDTKIYWRKTGDVVASGEAEEVVVGKVLASKVDVASRELDTKREVDAMKEPNLTTE